MEVLETARSGGAETTLHPTLHRATRTTRIDAWDMGFTSLQEREEEEDQVKALHEWQATMEGGVLALESFDNSDSDKDSGY
jgi:hypothetical protein